VIDAVGRTEAAAPASELPAAMALTLDCARTARIKAVDPGGKPLAGVTSYAWLLHKEGRRSVVHFASQIFTAKSGPDGVVTFDWLPTSDTAITLWLELQGYVHRRVDIEEGEPGMIIARLSREELIRGRVVRLDGSPAPGIDVRAIGVGNKRDSHTGQARSTADGSYEMAVGPDDAYAVYVDDPDWVSPSRLDVIVSEGKPADGVDFKLTRGTLVSGTVRVGPGNLPAANQFIRLAEKGSGSPSELTNIGRTVSTKTDQSGRYSMRVGSGTYTLIGPPRTSADTITIKDESEIIRDFQMPRPEKGTLTGRVVVAGSRDKGVARATVYIAAANGYSSPITVIADEGGRFHVERRLDPILVCAVSVRDSQGHARGATPAC
jgi:hypothetical protein